MSFDPAESQRLLSMWSNVRVVVVDVETTLDSDKQIHAVGIGIITVKGGRITGCWSSLVNPGTPIDERSQGIHGITDDDVADAPDFASVADTVTDLLEGDDGELVVFVGHHVAFDATVLRREFRRIGETIAELPVLDTMSGLPKTAGLAGGRHSLEDLCAALGVTNTSPHDALSDAQACAECLVSLVGQAVAEGYDDFQALVLAASGTRTTHNCRTRTSTSGSKDSDPHPPLPAEHLAGHSNILSQRAGVKQLKDWREKVRECAELRCELLEDRVAATGAPSVKTFPVLFSELESQAQRGDLAGCATVLMGLLPLCETRLRGLKRHQLVAECQRWSKLLGSLSRCDSDDLCPQCRVGRPCPLDVWPEVLGPLVLGDPARSTRSFLAASGPRAGTGPYKTWQNKGVDVRVCDAAMVHLLKHLEASNDKPRSDRLVATAWNFGCRHPDVAPPLRLQV